MREKISFLFL
jgi:epithelial splicing regulatory protein 1/2